jgi:threonylcarbamoyladenosine tRNA methylthiotransferase CDKAL1
VLQEGVREIWLTSEDLGTYGRDLKPAVRLPDLLWQMVAELPEGTMMRLGMTNPPYILEHMEEIAKVLSHPRVYSFLHIPVQAGSDSVLHDMRRQYTCAEFSQLCDFLLKHVEGGITIATDVICGFPTETDADFEETLGLVRKYKFPILYISQFYPRHGTPAAAMQQLRTQIKKSRSRKISTLFSTYKPYEGMIGSCHRVLITDRASDGVKLVGHNKHYHQILVADAEGLMGATVDVRIVQVGKFFMIGEVLGDWRAMQPLAPFVAAPTAPLSAPSRGG